MLASFFSFASPALLVAISTTAARRPAVVVFQKRDNKVISVRDYDKLAQVSLNLLQ